jgi:hypothetical protein
MLDVPNDLDRRVHALAEEIFAGRRTTADKIDAVIDHFRHHYTYDLGMDVPPGRDKLTHFLLEKSSGYCEYFASGAALLLRLADVPTRYVTGFLVTEKGPDGQRWVARNMDAHAWVEAWDQERERWTTVEATVPEGLGVAASGEETVGIGGGLGSLWVRELVEALHQYGLLGVLYWLLGGYSGVAYFLGLCLLLSGIVWWRMRRHRRRHEWRASRARGSSGRPEIAALHRLLARMDRHVRAGGLRRHLDEPLHAFSLRLAAQDAGDGSWTAVSEWYRRYADLRYGRRIEPQNVQDLARKARAAPKVR